MNTKNYLYMNTKNNQMSMFIFFKYSLSSSIECEYACE